MPRCRKCHGQISFFPIRSESGRALYIPVEPGTTTDHAKRCKERQALQAARRWDPDLNINCKAATRSAAQRQNGRETTGR